MSANNTGAPPSPKSNAGESRIVDHTSSHDSEKVRDTEPAVPVLDPIQPGYHDAEMVLKKLDSKIIAKKDASATVAPDPFAHLPEHEASILRKQVDTPDVKVGYFTLFRYANAFDWSVFAVSMFCAIVAGAAMPLMTVSVLQ